MESTETKVCQKCGRELNIFAFKTTAFGTRARTCNDCVREKREENRIAKIEAQKPTGPVSDPEFDNLQPREVIDIMSRGKKWLESRGYTIVLRGEYREVKIHAVKF